jgi:hypothetical protein
MVSDDLVWTIRPYGERIGLVKSTILILLTLIFGGIAFAIIFGIICVLLFLFGGCVLLWLIFDVIGTGVPQDLNFNYTMGSFSLIGLVVGIIIGLYFTIREIRKYSKKVYNSGYTYELTKSRAIIKHNGSMVNEIGLKDCTVIVMNRYQSIAGSSYGGVGLCFGDVMFRKSDGTWLRFEHAPDPDGVKSYADDNIAQIHD